MVAAAAPAHVVAAPTVVFVNFDGANLEQGVEDARFDQTSLAKLAGPFAAYGDGAKRDAVLQAVREDWSRYNVDVTDRRPDDGDYTMCLVGPTTEYPSNVLGIAPQDCGNSTPNNISFAFHSADDSHTAAATATTISQEIAHSFGLEHVSRPGDIMHPTNTGADASFTDECAGLSDAEPRCGEQHAEHCDSEYLQNSHAELLDLLGPLKISPEDSGLEIVVPADGESFEAGETVQIAAEASEAFGATQMALFVNGKLSGTDEQHPFGWTAPPLAEGTYELRVEAADSEGRVATSDPIVITVGPYSNASDDMPAIPPGGGAFRQDDGTGCSAHPRRPGATPYWLALALPIFLRRRKNQETT